MKEYIVSKSRINNGDDLMNVASATLLFKGFTMKTDDQMQDFMINARWWCTDSNFKLKPIITPVLGITDYDLVTGVPDGTFHHGLRITCRRIDCEYIGSLTPPQDETSPDIVARFNYASGVQNAWCDSVIAFVTKVMAYFDVPTTVVYIAGIHVSETVAVKISAQ